jgi:hypothetical protein
MKIKRRFVVDFQEFTGKSFKFGFFQRDHRVYPVFGPSTVGQWCQLGFGHFQEHGGYALPQCSNSVITPTMTLREREVAAVNLKHDTIDFIHDLGKNVDEIVGAILKYKNNPIIIELDFECEIDETIIDKFESFSVSGLEALVKYKDDINVDFFIAYPLQRSACPKDFEEKRAVYTALLDVETIDGIIKDWYFKFRRNTAMISTYEMVDRMCV